MGSVIDWVLHLHGIAALAIVFALPAAESSIFVGFIFPGETAAIVAGVLASFGRINLAAAIAAVVLGAVVGDTIGYFVGKRWGVKLLNGPLSRWIKESHVKRAREEIQKRGGAAVLVGRLTAVLRAIVPGVAGTAEMPYRKFLKWNIAGGVIWGTGFVLIGYAAGAGWRQVSAQAGYVALIILGVVVVAVAGFIVWRRLKRRAA